MKTQKITLGLLLTNLFIAFLGIGLVIPVLPTLMNELGITGTTIGYLTAAFALAQLIVSPFAGRAADKWGRKIMIVTGLFIFGLSEFLFGIGQEIEVLFVSRILGGISAAFIMPAVTAFIADITTTDTRPKALGYMSAAISTGFIIGPGIGGFLAEFGTRVPFFFAGAMGALAAALSMILLSEPERSEEENQEGAAEGRSGFRRVMEPKYFLAFILIFIASFGLAAFESFFSLFVDHKFAFKPSDIAIVITGGAIFGAVSQILLFDRLTRIWGEIKLIRYSLILSGLLVFLMTVVHSYFAILLVTFIVFVGFDLFRPAVTSYLSNIAGNEQGFVGGMNSMFTSLANISGPIIGGMLFDIDINYPYYFATVIMALGIGLTLLWKKPAEKASKVVKAV
ncbi:MULTISPECIES: multidrug efflux MFS transporter NorA [Cytobacillus]|uniref:multidrug efflux MFS transporter NorA n=1 Tax=Cytobacillus TaxID=2675230 RepID=UPI00204048D2|nr:MULTISPECIES: multidrug efflux MFS transporter NorA [Cytobacillus]MBY0156608.1 multidrug efflux MFS transporter NorA [Cytobacillus firmus]MCM3391104.1 multidrug efflux MFS transporter NorA [Cytobacillus oceanisediminis]MCM3531524.1 multidrug efflux MFS transporter NorA [Cytobacillus oceanisediminis]UQX52722.1 multidrug efflux MFS transporter NorA [Cytobacillus pseudoceanisediminis]USK45194.1 multidrug efflux MFS transporter NorA [Cytobacillus oceanisediminis]